MSDTPSRNGTALRSAPSIAVAARPRVARRRVPADLVAAVVFLGFALLFHLWRWRPEGTWVVESSGGVASKTASAGRATASTGTLRLDRSGHYRLEISGGGTPSREEEGFWVSTFDGFELHKSPWGLGPVGAFVAPVAHDRGGGTAELMFLDGRALVLRRTGGD
jgi:hypothetical protein